MNIYIIYIYIYIFIYIDREREKEEGRVGEREWLGRVNDHKCRWVENNNRSVDETIADG